MAIFELEAQLLQTQSCVQLEGVPTWFVWGLEVEFPPDMLCSSGYVVLVMWFWLCGSGYVVLVMWFLVM